MAMSPSVTVHVPSFFDPPLHDTIRARFPDLRVDLLEEGGLLPSFHLSGGHPDTISESLRFLEDHYGDRGVVAMEACSGIRLELRSSAALLTPRQSAPRSSRFFYATDMSSIYGITPRLTGPRTDIAILQLGGGYNTSDMEAYWDAIGLSRTVRPKLYDISILGAKNSPGQDADVEVVLDAQIVGGICPNSNLYIHFAPNTLQGFYTAISSAVYNTVTPFRVISISWGLTEKRWGVKNLRAFDDLFRAAAERGITVCVASGDYGATNNEVGLNVDFPASSPNVLSCGGTRLVCPNKRYDSKTIETVWQNTNNNGSTGGGFSAVFARPAYQAQAHARPTRGVPDVAGCADPTTGWIIFFRGIFQTVGGTSAVAPMWAALIANIQQGTPGAGSTSSGFINPFLYSTVPRAPAMFYDVVRGNNGGYQATRGWDATTGWGSPNGLEILRQWTRLKQKTVRS